ncbi:MAG: hypothetical protein LBQ93_08695, partial [Treponema sp.]|nr:hypothetical protein [Treponema sp.]
MLLSTEREGFGVPVANVLFALSTPAYALPGASCAGLFTGKAFALCFYRSAPFRIPQLPGNSNLILSDESVQHYIIVYG